MTSTGTRPVIRTIDLFAGCGGLSEGFRSFRADGCGGSPFATAAAVEQDIAAASTFAVNFAAEGPSINLFAGPIQDWTVPVGIGDIDVILGGPPCQGFSALGREDPRDPRNQLWREYLRVVNQVKPKLFVMENVDRFQRSEEFNALIASAEKLGGDLRDYILKAKVINAADYGVPQSRRRVFVLGTRRDVAALHDGKPLAHPSATHVRDRSGAPQIPGITSIEPWVAVGPAVFARTPEATRQADLPERWCSPLGSRVAGPYSGEELHVGRRPTALSVARYKAIPPGGNRHDLPVHLSTENWIRHRGGSSDVMGRLRWDEPSVTIRTEFFKPEKGRYLHPLADRPITHLEAALIQDFPADFRWCGSKIDIARQIGNAIPIGLGKAIADKIYGYITGGERHRGGGVHQ